MDQLEEVAASLSILASRFDQSLRAEDNDAELKGWGQFLDAEHQSNQVGLYGTSAAIAVKTFHKSDAKIDPAIVRFLQAALKQPKNRSQNVRLAFLVICLSRASSPELTSLRKEVCDELAKRALPDGGWGDGPAVENEVVAADRDATAIVLLALSMAGESVAAKNSHYLHDLVLGSRRIDKTDPLVLAAVLRTTAPEDVHRRIRLAAAQIIRRSKIGSDPAIYYFDFRVKKGRGVTAMRDFLCVPSFFRLAMLISAPGKIRKYPSIESLSRELGFQKLRLALIQLSADTPFKAVNADYPSTVDQAFYTIAVDAASNMDSKLRRSVGSLAPFYMKMREKFAVRVVLPICLAVFITTIAKDPKLIVQLFQSWASPNPSRIADFVTLHESSINWFGIVSAMLFGQPLLKGVISFLKRTWML